MSSKTSCPVSGPPARDGQEVEMVVRRAWALSVERRAQYIKAGVSILGSPGDPGTPRVLQWLAILGHNRCLVALNAVIDRKRLGSGKVFRVLRANEATDRKVLLMTLAALDELYKMGIGIRDFAEDLPFWDTTTSRPKKEIFDIRPFLAHISMMRPYRHVQLSMKNSTIGLQKQILFWLYSALLQNVMTPQVGLNDVFTMEKVLGQKDSQYSMRKLEIDPKETTLYGIDHVNELRQFE
ncbi:hypothetical protein B0H16DRAFT_1471863 [Mycena metata]|uniref:Uncharacterized protein n=1 Tax=Mycena metata TaxID=1033252 RepID=A0AAD7HR03_9AGAR|nr:hypothetical protein B0H16DRAFT_1471863 [Mycena metata]